MTEIVFQNVFADMEARHMTPHPVSATMSSHKELCLMRADISMCRNALKCALRRIVCHVAKCSRSVSDRAVSCCSIVSHRATPDRVLSFHVRNRLQAWTKRDKCV